jgi:hypothetical protein
MSKETKTDFLRQIVLSNVQSASFQRASIYAQAVQEWERSAFQHSFRQALSALEQRYKAPVTDEEHVGIIVSFANRVV